MFGWLIEIRPIFQTIYNKLVWRSKWREKLKNKFNKNYNYGRCKSIGRGVGKLDC